MEFLRDQVRIYWAWWDAAIEPHVGEPRRQLQALIQAYIEFGQLGGDFAGFALGSAAVELRRNDPASKIVHDHKAELQKRLRGLAKAAAAKDPAQLGDALQLIMDGGYLTRLSFTGPDGPFFAIAGVAETLLDAYIT